MCHRQRYKRPLCSKVCSLPFLQHSTLPSFTSPCVLLSFRSLLGFSHFPVTQFVSYLLTFGIDFPVPSPWVCLSPTESVSSQWMGSFLGLFIHLEPNTTLDMQQVLNAYFLAKTIPGTCLTPQKNLINFS